MLINIHELSSLAFILIITGLLSTVSSKLESAIVKEHRRVSLCCIIVLSKHMIGYWFFVKGYADWTESCPAKDPVYQVLQVSLAFFPSPVFAARETCCKSNHRMLQYYLKVIFSLNSFYLDWHYRQWVLKRQMKIGKLFSAKIVLTLQSRFLFDYLPLSIPFLTSFQGGESTTEEMCLNFIMYYPRANFTKCNAIDYAAAYMARQYAKPVFVGPFVSR